MIHIHVENRYAYIRGASQTMIKRLEKATSYYVSGFMYSPSFKSVPRRWDGKEHLMSFSPRRGYKIPSGLVADVVKVLRSNKKKYSVECKYKRNGPIVKYDWNPDIKLRPYQTDAVEKICSGKKWVYGKGLLKMPIRSGKTKTAAGIIYQLKRRTLFIVPSQMLLRQTIASLEESLSRKVGALGDGEWKVEEVTVATIQTLAKHAGGIKKVGKTKKRITIPPDEKFKSIARYFDLVIFDESHHLVADVWHAVVMGFDCRYKIGLSASIHLENEKEWERGVIWLKACCGNVRYEVETEALVKQGYLLRQNIELLIQREPTGCQEWKWGRELVNALIYENEHRNRRIVEKAIEKVELGMKVLIVSNRHNQLAELNRMLIEADIGHAIVIGGDNAASRKRKVEAFLDGEIEVLMGTIFGEGVDIPEIECVINAEGGQDIKTTIQRMRNMTPSVGKREAVFVDFIDLTNKYFAKHSKERLLVYRGEQAFRIRLIEESM
jgi:superfamily II DNA or RNA helicase